MLRGSVGMSVCSLYLAYCIAGGVQISPDTYNLQVLDVENGVITDYYLPMVSENFDRNLGSLH